MGTVDGVDEKVFVYHKAHFKTILEIFAQYRFFVVVYPKLILQVKALKERSRFLEGAVSTLKKSIKASREHTEYIHDVVDDQHLALGDQRRQAIIRGALIGGGGLLVGVGLGILIGVFAI